MLGEMAPHQRTRRSGLWSLYGVLFSVAAFAACTGEIEPAEGVKGAAPGGGGLPGQGGSSVFGSSNCLGYVCYDCASGKAVPATCETKRLCPEGLVADCTPAGGTSGVGGSGGAGTGGTMGKAGATGASGSAGATGSAGQPDASSGGGSGMGGRDSGSSGGSGGAPADASSD